MNSISKVPRRVVTGHKSGKSCFIEDDPVQNISEHIPGIIISDVWVTNTMPKNWNLDLQNQLDHVNDDGNDENFELRTAVDGSIFVSYIDFSSIIIARDADGDPAPTLAAGRSTIKEG